MGILCIAPIEVASPFDVKFFSLLLLLAVFSVSTIHATEPAVTITRDDMLARRATVIGDLGVPITEYLTVEGVPVAPTKTGTRYPSFAEIEENGVTRLKVYAVNGASLARPVVVILSGETKFPPANVYTLRGYQTLLIHPAGPDPQETKEFDLPQVTESDRYRFVPTKVLKAEAR